MKKSNGILCFLSGNIFPKETYPDLERGKVFITADDGKISTGDYWILSIGRKRYLFLSTNPSPEKIPFPEYKPLSGGKMFFDQRGNILSKKYGGFSSDSFSTWIKINIQSGDISFKKFETQLLYPTSSSIYVAEERENGPMVIRYDRKELEF